MPVRMSRAPSTANPGSILVSKWRGSGGGVAVGEVVFEAAELVDDDVGVTVTLKTTGTTVVTGMSELPDRKVVVIVAEVVVREREGVGEGVVAEDELEAWATTGRRKRRVSTATADHDKGCRGIMAGGSGGGGGGGRDEERTGIREGVYQRAKAISQPEQGLSQPRSQGDLPDRDSQRQPAADVSHVGAHLSHLFPNFQHCNSLQQS